LKKRLEGSVLFVFTESTFALYLHKVKAAFVSYRKSTVCFRVLQGLFRACGERDCGGALYFCAVAERTKGNEVYSKEGRVSADNRCSDNCDESDFCEVFCISCYMRAALYRLCPLLAHRWIFRY